MHYRDRFLLFSLSLLMASSGYAGDKHTGKVVFPDSSVTGNTTMGGGVPKMPSEPMDFKPEMPQKPTGGGSSGWGGIIGFIINLGKKSDKEIRMDMVTEARDRAEWKSVNGIPWDSEDFAATGTSDMSNMPSYKALFPNGRYQAPTPTVPAPTPAPVTPPAPVAIAPIAKPDAALRVDVVSAPEVVKAIEKVTEMVKAASSAQTIAGPATYIPAPMTPPTLSPALTTDQVLSQLRGYGTLVPASSPVGVPKAPAVPDFSNIIKYDPRTLGGPNSGGGIGGGTGTLVTGAGLLTNMAVNQTAVAAPVVAGGAATTAGATTVGGVIIAAAPWVAVGVAAGMTIAATYEYFARPVDGTFFSAKKPTGNATSPEEYHADAYLDPFDNFVYKEGMKSRPVIPQSSHNAPNNSSPNPKKPDEPKERKVNTVQRSEAFNKIKKDYRFDKQIKAYRLKDNGKPIINSRTGKPVEIVYWDGQHGDIEAWKNVYRGDHLGSLDPHTFEMYKGPDPKRSIL